MSSKRKLTFLVDACLSAEILEYLSSLRKIKVVSFRDAGLRQDAEDPIVIQKSTDAGAILITSDKRFTENYIPFCTHQGMIKFGVKPTTRLRALKKFLKREERHQAWKGVTHLFEDQFEMKQHGGERISRRY